MNPTWMIWEEINSLVAKNAYVFVWKLIRWNCMHLMQMKSVISLSALILSLPLLHLNYMKILKLTKYNKSLMSWFCGDLDRLIVQIMFTLFMVPHSSNLVCFLHVIQNCYIFNSFCISWQSRVASRSCLYQLLSWCFRTITDAAIQQRCRNSIFIATAILSYYRH